jgi:hypothetical protein
MSTVDRQTADDVIAGKYPDTLFTHIVRYENAFNGNFAYKLCRSVEQYQDVMKGSPYVLEPELFWSAKGGKVNAE